MRTLALNNFVHLNGWCFGKMSCGWLGQLFTVVKKTGGPLILALIVVNIVMLVSGLLISIPYPALLSSVIIAYTLGLRHAVDADHLAAIDNVTRKLVSEGQKPVTVGLFFSLGHSTIVFALSCFVAISASLVSEYFPEAQEVGDILGTTISASFLLLIGFINLYCLIKLTIEWRAFNREKKLKGFFKFIFVTKENSILKSPQPIVT